MVYHHTTPAPNFTEGSWGIWLHLQKPTVKRAVHRVWIKTTKGSQTRHIPWFWEWRRKDRIGQFWRAYPSRKDRMSMFVEDEMAPSLQRIQQFKRWRHYRPPWFPHKVSKKHYKRTFSGGWGHAKPIYIKCWLDFTNYSHCWKAILEEPTCTLF